MKFSNEGVAVSPAPLSDCTIIMPTAYMGYPTPMICRQMVPMRNTAGSVVNNETICGARPTEITPRVVMKIVLYSVARQADFAARSGLPAPRFCPTSVAAAFPIPQAGKNANSISLRAMV